MAGSRSGRSPAAGHGTSSVIRVDRIRCDGYGMCAEMLPELIDLDDWGYPIIDPEPIPRSLRRHARRAVTACPVLALRLAAAEPPAAQEAGQERGRGPRIAGGA